MNTDQGEMNMGTTKSYHLSQTVVDTIEKLAKDTGDCSVSAALRIIVTDWVNFKAQEANHEIATTNRAEVTK